MSETMWIVVSLVGYCAIGLVFATVLPYSKDPESIAHYPLAIASIWPVAVTALLLCFVSECMVSVSQWLHSADSHDEASKLPPHEKESASIANKPPKPPIPVPPPRAKPVAIVEPYVREILDYCRAADRSDS